MIDLSITATLRPEVLEQTLQSIRRNLWCNSGYRLIVNIDSVGRPNCSVTDVMNAARKYYGNNCIFNISTANNYFDAVMWNWSQATSEFVLHWEDDWALGQIMRLDPIIETMKANSKVGCILFDRVDFPVSKFDSWMRIVGNVGYWERKSRISNGFPSFGGSPQLLSLRYIKKILSVASEGELSALMSCKSNKLRISIGSWFTWVYTGAYGSLVQDIGRDWIKQQSLVRYRTPGGGVIWKVPK